MKQGDPVEHARSSGRREIKLTGFALFIKLSMCSVDVTEEFIGEMKERASTLHRSLPQAPSADVLFLSKPPQLWTGWSSPPGAHSLFSGCKLAYPRTKAF